MTVFASIKARIRNLTSANGPKLLRDLASLATGQLTSDVSMIIGAYSMNAQSVFERPTAAPSLRK